VKFELYFDEAAMHRYYKAANWPKEIKWYYSGYDLSDPATLVDWHKWLREKIGLDGTRSIFEPVESK
jgi:hypothetical protein